MQHFKCDKRVNKTTIINQNKELHMNFGWLEHEDVWIVGHGSIDNGRDICQQINQFLL